MKALELADRFERYGDGTLLSSRYEDDCYDVAKELRRLTSENEKLQSLACLGEPVAWLHRFHKHTELSFFGDSSDGTTNPEWIGRVPLYAAQHHNLEGGV